jgi:hypothetical protein
VCCRLEAERAEKELTIKQFVPAFSMDLHEGVFLGPLDSRSEVQGQDKPTSTILCYYPSPVQYNFSIKLYLNHDLTKKT